MQLIYLVAESKDLLEDIQLGISLTLSHVRVESDSHMEPSHILVNEIQNSTTRNWLIFISLMQSFAEMRWSWILEEGNQAALFWVV